MHPRDHLNDGAGRPALVMAASGDSLSFDALDRQANQWAQLFRRRGLRPGDRIALWMGNDPLFFVLCWAAHNSGLFYVPVSNRLTGGEAAFIVRDSDARLVIAVQQPQLEAFAAELAGAAEILLPGDKATVAALADLPASPIPDEVRGAAMLYSSGTTGRPKGIMPAADREPIDSPPAVTRALVRLYGFDAATIYLSTAPFYHAAPLKFTMAVQAAGGTVIAMESFDAEAALAAIERYRVTHSQWVPTMFIRLLNLPEEVRNRHDLSSHRLAMHGAAPCPVPVKERMLDWWGPIIHEYYGGSESVGMCAIGPEEWTARKGSVGRAVRGAIHIVGEDGRECAPGETGLVCFEGCTGFRYHGEAGRASPDATPPGLGTFGDIGHIDQDAYLYLTDRRDYVINVGGVNVYPLEAENLLAIHPKVGDVAVFGVPHPELGEEVKAVVQPAPGIEPGPALAVELIDHCRAGLASIKCPRSIDFEAAMPREETGKLFKRRLKARYWPGPPGAANQAEAQ